MLKFIVMDDKTEILNGCNGNPPEQFNVGQILLSRFKLSKFLGEGGMGIVWEAIDLFLDEAVALKIFNKKNISKKDTERIKREISKGRSLKHKNLLKYYDIFETEDFLISSMELIKGDTLKEKIKKSDLNEGEIKNIIRQIVDVIDYLHNEGIIHRDIKPANIFINEEGEVILGDLGIIFLEGTEPITQRDTVIGTVHYMPPEAFERIFSPAYDYYSLGITLYEVVTKKVPFDGTVPEIIHSHQGKAPPPINIKVSENIKNLISGLLIKDSEKRWGKKEIDDFLNDMTLPLLPKTKNKINYFIIFTLILIFAFILINIYRIPKITHIKMEGEKLIAFDNEKKLWEKEFENLLGYKLFDIENDGKKEVFIERVFALNETNLNPIEIINSKGKMIKLNLMQKENPKRHSPVWSHWYKAFLFNFVNNLKIKDVFFIHICHSEYYPTNIILYDLKKREELCNIINPGRVISILGFKDKILFLAHANPYLRQYALIVTNSLEEMSVPEINSFNIIQHSKGDNISLFLSDQTNYFGSKNIAAYHLLSPNSKIDDKLNIILEDGEVLKIKEDGSLSNQKDGSGAITLELLNKYYEAKHLTLNKKYDYANGIIEENIEKAKAINSKGFEALFKNLKSINIFYSGNLEKAIELTEENFKNFSDLQYFKVQKGIFYLLKSKYKEAIDE